LIVRASSSTLAPRHEVGWRAFAAGFGLAILAFAVLPDGSWPQTAAFCLIGFAAAAAGLLAARRARHPGPWRWMAAGVAANALGTPVERFVAQVLHSDAYPSLADVCYLGLYPGLGVGLALLVRRIPGESLRASLLDSSIIVAGAGLLSWILCIHPVASAPDLTLAGRTVSIAYPLADLVVLAMVTRLLFVTSLQSAAYRLVFAAVALFLAVDTTWGLVNKASWTPGPWADKGLQMLVLAAYGLVALAVMHPAARDSQPESVALSSRLRPPLLLALTAAALTSPTVLAVEALRGHVDDGLAVALGSALLFVLVVLRMSGLLAQVAQQAALLRELALADELTGLANRRALVTELNRSCEQAGRSGTALALAVLDLDHFKQFNDLFGHVEGDRLLAATAQAWQRRLRGSDLLARYGGEEFVVVLPATDAETAAAVLADLRAVTPVGLTFSGGLAAWSPGESSDALITRADRALYEAKAQGRDRVVMACDAAVAAAPKATAG
jgi:diguanylate cyclase